MPDCDEFILSVWHELGRYNNGMDGLTPLSFLEVGAYSENVNELTGFDIKMVVMMSRSYISEYNAATNDISRPAPHEGEGNLETMRASVASAFKAMFKKPKVKTPGK